MLLRGDGWIDGIVPTDNPNADTLANYRWIGPDYFNTLEQRIVDGRALDAHDRTTKTAVISQATAKAVWPGQSPINRQFKRNGNTLTVVGVVAEPSSSPIS